MAKLEPYKVDLVDEDAYNKTIEQNPKPYLIN